MRWLTRTGAGSVAFAWAFLVACSEEPLAVPPELAGTVQAARVEGGGRGGGKPDGSSDDAAIDTWRAMAVFSDAVGDGLVSDGEGAYTSNGKEISVAYNFSLTSSKEDRVFLGHQGQGNAPRFFRLVIPGVVDMECGLGQYLASAPDLFDQPAGTTVTDGHLTIQCATDKRAPRYLVEFGPCVGIANPAADRYVVSTTENCSARVDFDGTTLGYFPLSHGLQADLER
jgi:hypothetical protein